MRKRVLVTLLLAVVVVAACGKETVREVRVQDSTSTTRSTLADESGNDDFCNAYLVWWNTETDTADEEAAWNVMDAAKTRVTSPTLLDIIERFDTVDDPNIANEIDAYCDIVPTEDN